MMLGAHLLALVVAAAQQQQAPQPVGQSLHPPKFAPLPIRELQTAGWLRRQMDLAARGLAGNEHLIWPWLSKSQFLGRCNTSKPNRGGIHECEGWQFSTYAMNGIVPTSFLGSAEATASIRNFSEFWMSYQKAHQEEDGWVGPGSATNPIINTQYTNQSYDTYPSLMHLMAMAQYHDATLDGGILSTMSRLMHKISDLYHSPQCVRPRGRTMWPVCGGGACEGGVCKCCVTTRYPELVWSAVWLHDRTQDPWLLAFLQQIHDTVATENGQSWVRYFEKFNCTTAYTAKQCGAQHLANHGVDVAEGIKYGALRWRLTGNPSDLEASLKAVRELWRYHGQADGVMSNDENLGGLEPQHGTETCSVVETLFSLETTAMISGSVEVADAAERVAYNAMPGFSTPNQWGHVYFQYSNQPRSGATGSQAHYKTWAGTIPCCTANHPQGWAKWSQHLLAKSTASDGRAGLTVVHYAPIQANTTIGAQHVSLDVSSWCTTASIVAHSAGVSLPSILQNGTYACAEVSGGGTSFTLRLPMENGRIERRINNAAVILRGPLVFSLAVAESWQGGVAPSSELAVKYGDAGYNLALTNTSRWAYALNLSSLRFHEVPGELPALPWDRSMAYDHPTLSGRYAPMIATVEAKFTPEWEEYSSLKCFECAGLDVPCSPLNASRVSGDSVSLVLQPYGSTQLRISEWPLLEGTPQPPGEAQNCTGPGTRPTSCPAVDPKTLPPNAVPNSNLPCAAPVHPDPGCDIVPHGQGVKDIDACWKLCQGHTHCRAWVFSRGGYSPGVHGGKAWCWLKNASNIKRTHTQCFVSASCKAGTGFPCGADGEL